MSRSARARDGASHATRGRAARCRSPRREDSRAAPSPSTHCRRRARSRVARPCAPRGASPRAQRGHPVRKRPDLRRCARKTGLVQCEEETWHTSAWGRRRRETCWKSRWFTQPTLSAPRLAVARMRTRVRASCVPEPATTFRAGLRGSRAARARPRSGNPACAANSPGASWRCRGSCRARARLPCCSSRARAAGTPRARAA